MYTNNKYHILQNTNTRNFWTNNESWSCNILDARRFETYKDIFDYADQKLFRETEILTMNHTTLNLLVPCRAS
jgi:hypothetical protein